MKWRELAYKFDQSQNVGEIFLASQHCRLSNNDIEETDHRPSLLLDDDEATPLTRNSSHHHSGHQVKFGLYAKKLSVCLGMGIWGSKCAQLYPVQARFLYDIAVEVFDTSQERVLFFQRLLYFGGVLGCLLVALLANRIGRATLLELATIPYIVGWLFLGSVYSQGIFLLGKYLIGASVAIFAILIPIYLAEMAVPRHRGRMLAVSVLVGGVGKVIFLLSSVLISELSGRYPTLGISEWKILATCAIFPAVILLIGMEWYPESPPWMVLKYDNHANSFQSLKKVYNGNHQDAQLHLNRIVHAKVYNTDQCGSHVGNQSNLIPRSLYFRACLLCMGLLVLKVVGYWLIEPTLFAISKTKSTGFEFAVFGQAKLNYDGEYIYFTLIKESFAIIGIFVCCQKIDIDGRKSCLIIGSSFNLFLCSTLCLLLQLDMVKARLTIYIFVFLITAGYYLSLAIVPTVMMIELIPVQYRALSTSLFFLFESACHLGMSYLTFLFNFNLEVIAIISIILYFVLLAISHFFVLESKQRPLEEIEAIFSQWIPVTPPAPQSSAYLHSNAKNYGT